MFGESVIKMQGDTLRGAQQAAILHNSSLFHMHGGLVRTGVIEALDSSRVIIDGGEWREVNAFASSRVRVNGGIIESLSFVQTFGNAHAALDKVRFNFIADETSTMVIKGGNYELAEARGDSALLIDGGHYATGLTAFDNAILRIRHIDSISEEYVDISNNAVAHVYGTNLRFEVSPENRPLVRGTWPDGGNFAFRYRLFDQGQIILHEVPEPTTAPLLAVGAAGLAIANRRRSFWRRSQLK